MPVISCKKLKKAVSRHAELEAPLNAWFRIAGVARGVFLD